MRLTTLAFERATRGTVCEIWKEGQLVQQMREPSDRLLMFLLQHLLPRASLLLLILGDRWDGFEAMTDAARNSSQRSPGALGDHACEMVPVVSRDFFPEVPGDLEEDT
ncbi:hypothetical protein [uncultured Sphingomonas sp.]|uniref:hypothetical protein n=1 Tax=uncultured Sphingomonas sp. TaxID=158754 RepID=UPI002617B580|nr:hypothetical protein [uncultured Sphingomonas sp.]